uniref:Chemotaxis protein CheA n=1 Tax=Desulfatirhabdium butyrativorans TaxID=340467 RepID=A0A7C4MNS3_9BACT
METLLRFLDQILDDLDTIGFSDADGWQRIQDGLDAISDEIPKSHEFLKPLSHAMVRLAAAIREERTANAFAAVSAMVTGVHVLRKSLEGELVEAGELDGALQSVISVFVEGEHELTHTDLRDPNAGMDRLSLINDAAMRLVQIDTGDRDALSSWIERVESFFKEHTFRDAVVQRLKSALLEAHRMLDSDVSDWDSGMEQIGGWLEEAAEIEDTGADVPITTESSTEEMNTYDVSASERSDEMDFMPKHPDRDLIAEFVVEGNELIARAEEALLTLEVDPENMDAVATVFRAFHTIKGTSAFLELSLLADMGHHAETLLSRVRDKEIRYAGGYADLALRSLDMLKAMLQDVQAALEGAPLRKPSGYDDLMAVLVDPERAGVSETSDGAPSPRVGDILVAQGKVDRKAVEEIAQSETDVPIGLALVKKKITTITDTAQALRTQSKLTGTKQFIETSVRVSTERLDRLIDMVGELVIAHSMVAQDAVVMQAHHYDLLKKVNHTTKIVRTLQDLCMSMRMIPLKATFQKMARLVRDVARKVGKNVVFHTEGEDTEIDRNLVDVINDPLVHMVRNAIDHGIETPEARMKVGKPEQGTIKLSAYHAAGNVVVEIADDGRGLDKTLILKKAIEKGMIPENTVLSDREIYNLILEPGFSTAAVVTDVSGRGVGMDVVKKNIESLRGQVEISSEPGKGSVFRMKLPLTLAIIDGMVVRAGEETYVIPTASIVRSIKPDATEVSTVLRQGNVLKLQNELIPLFRLTDLYRIASSANAEDELVVIVEDEHTKVGFVIDELIGRQQVVIKSLGEAMQHIPGISGGAIMPDGRVGLILDVSGLIKLAVTDKGSGTFKEWNSVTPN